MKTKKIDVKLDEDLKEKFDRICRDQAVNKSELIRKWIKDFVKENEGK